MINDKIRRIEEGLAMNNGSLEIREMHNVILQLADAVTALQEKVDGGIKLYSIEDVMRLTGYSRKIVQDIFNDPDLVVVDRGKRKFVEESVLRNYFTTKHNNVYWKKLEAARKNTAKKAA